MAETGQVAVMLLVDTSRFTKAAARAAHAIEGLTIAFAMSRARSRTGWRRHGAIKHARDLRRAHAKRSPR